jgi:glucan biosynthesis protein C
MTDSVQRTTKPERRREVDLMRALMVLGLILFHTARIFDLLPFYVKNDEVSLTFMVLVGFVSQWGMPLFFLIAGIAAWHALASRTVSQFVRERFRRLIVPLIFGMFVLVPPQHYYNLRTDPSYQEPYWQFYPSFFRTAFKFDFPWFIREPAHLWFLYYLFVFSMMALPVFVYLRRDAGQSLVSRLAAFCQRRGAIFLLALPIIMIETFIVTEESTGWNRYSYIPFLVYGYLLAGDGRFEDAMHRHRKLALVGGTLAVMAFFAVSTLTWQAGTDPSRGYGWQSILWRLLKSCSSWLWIVAILGWAKRFKQRRTQYEQHDSLAVKGMKDEDGQPVPRGGRIGRSKIIAKISRYANEAVLAFYIIHQTVIVVIGFYVVKWETGVMVKYLTITTGTFVITLLLYDVVRRINLTRFLFGMKPIKPEDRSREDGGLSNRSSDRNSTSPLRTA